MIEIDGSAGGGQILRSALSLAALSGDAVRVEHVRGDRRKPGLKHQHLACVEAAAAACDADVDGAELGSETVAFDPGRVRGGSIEVAVGTAGAVALVFETVLPLCVALDAELSVTATGGTDVAWSPTLDYYRTVRLPLARRAGWRATVDVARRGFYPKGGGEATLHVEPAATERVRFDRRGRFEGASVEAVASADLADADVADRLVDGALDALEDVGVAVDATAARSVRSPGTGASVLVRLEYEHTVAGFTALGEPGTPAEAVGADAATDALAFHQQGRTSPGRGGPASPPVVDAHAADQLVLPLARGGGRVRPTAVTDHVETNCAVARAFDRDVHLADGVLVAEHDPVDD
ncbi:RNA 3'-terminal phosphate cyclase [Halorubellus sp. JP-L1]|uniref:RNA 3'-terminal phosphate cyclase n=1 Tax=Halorubellus sp. JP-L1 TaxID=2715753 RepID=UPI00140DCA15|nr:RNA 3'-terminal phosphate cyclase [Halorubellus sp. JP-L1]NHN41985.1 RNA 3'-terminal phosphate cyclase [Halorubellus sp. JP-L1]